MIYLLRISARALPTARIISSRYLCISVVLRRFGKPRFWDLKGQEGLEVGPTIGSSS